MKKGFTTGSCAAAAARAAAYMLLGGNRIEQIEIETPAGEKYRPLIEETEIGEDYVQCAVRKDSGDDPDITDGILVYAKASFREASDTEENVVITAGRGVGRVTRPGLDQPVGNAAINTVPRLMIRKEVAEIMEILDYEGTLEIEISVPEGEKLAGRTFNPRLGIEGGISIIGTTGIVEPMSTRALIDTIKVELRQQKSMGAGIAVVTPGNYGLDFMKQRYGYDLDRAVKCANHIGETIDMASELGFRRMLLCGHIGKLIKVSGGIMNTHSRESDCRMELMASAAVSCGAEAGALRDILSCVSTEEAIEIYLREGIKEQCFYHIMERIGFYLDKRGAGSIDVQCMVYSNKYGLLGMTRMAEEYLDQAKGNM